MPVPPPSPINNKTPLIGLKKVRAYILEEYEEAFRLEQDPEAITAFNKVKIRFLKSLKSFLNTINKP